MKEYTDEYVLTGLLKELVNSKELCAVYSDSVRTTKFCVGHILGIDDEFYLIERVDPFGLQDGLGCSRIGEIIKVERDNVYLKNLAKLIHYHKQKAIPKISCGDDMKLSLIDYAQKHKKVCEFELCESDNKDIIGFVKSYKDGLLTVQTLTETGDEDGESCIPMEAIDVIVCNSVDENKIEILHKLQAQTSKREAK